MSRVAAQDPVAQRELAARVLGRIRRVARSILGHDQDSEDATQTSFIEIMRAASGFRGDSSLERWVDRIVVRTSMRLVRARRLRAHEELDVDALGAAPLASRARDETPRSIEDYLAAVPATLRTVLVLRHVMDYSIEEIAQFTEASPNTVKDRLLRARAQMRSLIRRDLTLGIPGRRNRG
jgi:RNA polymerase sigma-70 factor (ECF subfamily)